MLVSEKIHEWKRENFKMPLYFIPRTAVCQIRPKNVVLKVYPTVKSKFSKVLSDHQCKALLDETDVQYGDVLNQQEVR